MCTRIISLHDSMNIIFAWPPIVLLCGVPKGHSFAWRSKSICFHGAPRITTLHDDQECNLRVAPKSSTLHGTTKIPPLRSTQEYLISRRPKIIYLYGAPRITTPNGVQELNFYVCRSECLLVKLIAKISMTNNLTVR